MEYNTYTLGVFLDLSKAFDQVWHAGLLWKLNYIDIQGKLFQNLWSYLGDRRQFVVLNGHKSGCKTINAGFPQGSVLGPLLFLMYVNDITDKLQNMTYLFADDTSLFCLVLNNNVINAVNIINSDLRNLDRWAKKWHVTINASKTVAMLFSRLLLGEHVILKKMYSFILSTLVSNTILTESIYRFETLTHLCLWTEMFNITTIIMLSHLFISDFYTFFYK